MSFDSSLEHMSSNGRSSKQFGGAYGNGGEGGRGFVQGGAGGRAKLNNAAEGLEEVEVRTEMEEVLVEEADILEEHQEIM